MRRGGKGGCHVIYMSDDVISLAPPLSVSGPVVSMFAAWRDNLISGATANAKSRLSEGGGKKEVPGPDQLPPPVHSHLTRRKEDQPQPQTPISVFFNHCAVTL